MTNLTQKLICGAAAFLAATTCLAGSAAQAETPRSRAVSYADLNLANDAGKATLVARVRGAAAEVCRASGTSPRELSAEKRCIETAVETAMTKAASIS